MMEEDFMQSHGETAPVSRIALWTGRVISILPALNLTMSAGMKLLKTEEAVESFKHLGWDPSVAVGLGIAELACTVLYVVPRTAVLGAILLTGYLGGAVATHLRIGDPLFTHVLFPTYMGAMLWGGLYLRDDRLRALIPLRKPRAEAVS